MRKLVVATLIGAACLGSAPAADFRLDQVLDPDTVLYLGVGNLGELSKGYEGSRLCKLLSEPALRTFLESIETPDGAFEKGLDELFGWPAKVEKEVGKKPLEALKGLGEVALAVSRIDPAAPTPEAILTLDLKGDAKLEAFIRKQIGDVAGENKNTVKVDDVECSAYGPVLVGKVKTVLFFALGEEAARKVIRGASKPPAESLATSAAYKHARQAVRAGDGAAFFYLNAKPILQLLDENIPTWVKPALDGLGLGKLNYIAASTQFEEKKIVSRGHLNASLSAAAPALEPDVFAKSPAEIRKDPSLRFLQMGYSDAGQGLKKLFVALNPILQMGIAQAGARADFSTFPIDAIAEQAGVAEEAVLMGESGTSFLSRTDAGISFSFLGGSTGMMMAVMIPVMGSPTQQPLPRAAPPRPVPVPDDKDK